MAWLMAWIGLGLRMGGIQHAWGGAGPAAGDGMLMESGDFLLAESGDFLLLE